MALNIIVFFVNSFVVEGGCISLEKAGEVKRTSGNVSAFI
jgi:hypothetical protein